MKFVEKRQKDFEVFEVPDPIRIKKAVGFARGYFKNFKGLNILECGIVKGGFVDSVKSEGAKCFGVDINPRKMEGSQIVQADLNEGLPDFQTKFDIIFAGEVMEHLFDDEAFVRQCNESLKPGGLLIITVPNLVFGPDRLRMLFGKMPLFAHAPYHYHLYNKKVLEYLISQNGFEVLKIKSSHVLFSTRRNKIGRIFEIMGDIFPSFGAHLIIFARKI